MPKANVDKSLCIGCGACAAIHPEIFEIGDDGLAEGVNEGEEAAINEAAESCPVQAITAE